MFISKRRSDTCLKGVSFNCGLLLLKLTGIVQSTVCMHSETKPMLSKILLKSTQAFSELVETHICDLNGVLKFNIRGT